MKLEDWEEANTRLDICLKSLGKVPRHTRADCKRMSQVVRHFLQLADQERVNCRRKRCVTTKFEQLMTQAQEALNNFESHVIFASLLKEPE